MPVRKKRLAKKVAEMRIAATMMPCRCRHPRCKQCRLSNIKKATVKVSKRRVPNKKKVDSKELAFRGSRNFFVKAKSLTKKDERFIYQHNCFMVKHQRLGARRFAWRNEVENPMAKRVEEKKRIQIARLKRRPFTEEEIAEKRDALNKLLLRLHARVRGPSGLERDLTPFLARARVAKQKQENIKYSV